MEIISAGTQIDFIRLRRTAILLSLSVITIGVVVMILRGGPKLGIDFTGGSLVEVRFSEPTDIADLRSAMSAAGVSTDAIQDLGRNSREFLIRLPLHPGQVEELTNKVTGGLAAKFGKERFEIRRIEAVGPRIGQALRMKAALAVLAATVMMGVYVWARFELRFGLGAAIALVHDVAVVLTALVVWNHEFDLTILAALLTVVGFSVNDTVIVCDRIRENMRKDRRSPLAAVINRSINETLSRTVLTTGTAVFVVLALYLLGGPVIHGFAFTLLVGFLVGTYSSIYIASPVVLFFEGGLGSARRKKG